MNMFTCCEGLGNPEAIDLCSVSRRVLSENTHVGGLCNLVNNLELDVLRCLHASVGMMLSATGAALRWRPKACSIYYR